MKISKEDKIRVDFSLKNPSKYFNNNSILDDL